MERISESTKSKINKLYFYENLTIPEIARKLNIPYQNTLKSIKRGNVYKLGGQNQRIKNNEDVLNLISSEVSNYFGLNDGFINKKTRLKDIVIPRQIAHAISYNLTKSSNAFIGEKIGKVDHATVYHSRSEILNQLDYPNDVRFDYEKLEKICQIKIKEYEESINKGIS